MINQFNWPLRVYYEDTDAGGVVYYANYLNFFERARTELLRSLGFEQDRLMVEEGVIFAVRSITVDYLKPAKFNDDLIVSADVAAIKRASLLFEQRIARVDDSQITFCAATVRIACLDCHSLKPKPMPQSIMQAIQDAR